MPKKQQLGGDIIDKYLKKFPATPTLSLARKIYAENIEVYKNVETVRSRIRMKRGANGKKDFKYAKFAEQTKLVKERLELPKSKKNDVKPYILPKANRKVLILSDIHAPFQDNEAIEIAVNYGKKNKIDTVLLNGDIVDFHAISRWQSDPRTRSIKEELLATKKILEYIRKSFPKALIIYKLGNHDIRLEDYMINKAPELLDTEFWQIEYLLEFEKYKIVKVGSLDYIKLGKLKVIHGHEYKGGFVAPVNPARGLFLRTKESCLQSHVHRTSEHTEKTIGGKVIVCFSIGCLSDLQPNYNRYNNYNLGFAMVEVESNGNFTVHNKKIVEGRLY